MTHPLSAELRDLPEWTVGLGVTYRFYLQNAELRRRAADALDEMAAYRSRCPAGPKADQAGSSVRGDGDAD